MSEWLFCETPEWLICDGVDHYWSMWDEDILRAVPQQGRCPLREANREVMAEEMEMKR